MVLILAKPYSIEVWIERDGWGKTISCSYGHQLQIGGSGVNLAVHDPWSPVLLGGI